MTSSVRISLKPQMQQLSRRLGLVLTLLGALVVFMPWSSNLMFHCEIPLRNPTAISTAISHREISPRCLTAQRSGTRSDSAQSARLFARSTAP